jgi:hypothetical protein
MAEKGAHMAPKGAIMRILAPFGEMGKKHSVFQLFFNIFFNFY